MPELSQIASTPTTQIAEVRLAALADRQWGRVARRQLMQIGLANATITSWVRRGRLHRVLPGVYAVGHRAPSTEGDLVAALLYAGPGAALSHTTAAWWRGLLRGRPTLIHVATRRRCRSIGEIRPHHRPEPEREWHQGLPTTPIPHILLDLAALGARRTLRKALAQAEFKRLLNLEELDAILGRGVRGSAALREALQRHVPQLARTKSELEDDFVLLCERFRIPVPEVNVKLEGWEVDASWPDLGVAVELDGVGNHGTQAAVARDRNKELALRKAGLVVLRYSAEQVNARPAEVAADVVEALDAAQSKHRARIRQANHLDRPDIRDAT